jgi:hypothetical protein
VPFWTQGRSLWVGNRRVAQMAGTARRNEVLRGEERRSGDMISIMLLTQAVLRSNVAFILDAIITMAGAPRASLHHYSLASQT